jgi:hypothetical protein
MITFTKDSRRFANFNDAKSKLNSLELFEAVNAIDNYKSLESIDQKFGFHSQNYLDKWKWLPGKLGCNLSYLKIFKDFSFNHSFYQDYPKWLLVLEDDTEITRNISIDYISSIFKEADHLKSKMIKFFISNGKERLSDGIFEFSPEIQKQKKYHIKDNFYKLIPCWGTWAQVFHIDAVNILLNELPWGDHIDQILMRAPVFEKLNATFYDQDFFSYQGAKRLEEANDKLGSLIFNNSTTGKVDWKKLIK